MMHSIASTLLITDTLTIDGNGSGTGGTVVDGNDTFGLFMTNPGGDVTFEDIRLQEGSKEGGGGAVDLNDDATFVNATLTENEAAGATSGFGGAVRSPSSTNLTLTNSTVTNNTIAANGFGANNVGGGIYVGGTFQMTNSVVSGNTITEGDTGDGAGIFAEGPIDIDDSTISGNSVSGTGTRTGGGLRSTGSATKPIGTRPSVVTAASEGDGDLGSSGDPYERHLHRTTPAATGADLLAVGGPNGDRPEHDLRLLRHAELQRHRRRGHHRLGDSGTQHRRRRQLWLRDTRGTWTTRIRCCSLIKPVPRCSRFHPGVRPARRSTTPTRRCGGGLDFDQRGRDRPQGPACDIGAYERDYRDLTVTVAGQRHRHRHAASTASTAPATAATSSSTDRPASC